MSSPATMRSIVRVFTSLLLLIVLVRLSDGSGTELSRKSRELTDEQIKDLEKLKTVMKYLKTLSNNVPTVGPYISALFGFVEIVVDTQIPSEVIKELNEVEKELDQLRLDVSRGINEIKGICAGLIFEQIAIDVGALFGMLRQTIRMRNDTFFVRTFTDACEKESLMQVLYSIPVLFESTKANILKQSLETDEFHRTTTIDAARMKILETSNKLAILEVSRIRFANESDINYQRRKATAALTAVIEINSLMLELMNDYRKQIEYFPHKMETIVAHIMKDMTKSTDKQKAIKTMETLKLIHTNDKFVVVMYNSDSCPLNSFVSAVGGSNLYVDKTHKTIIYRSRLISSMTKQDQAVWGTSHKNADIGFCEKMNISPVLRASRNTGLVLFDKSECITAQRVKERKWRPRAIP